MRSNPQINWTICLLNSNEVLKRSLCKTVPEADKTTVVEYNVYRICIGNSVISSDIWHKYHE